MRGGDVDKAKLQAAADKFIAKAQNDKALEVLEQILSQDAQDMKALSKASDLYLKIGNTSKASECLRRIGEIYTRDGFYSKAIAIYKRILKIDEAAPKSELVRTHDLLANLYSQLGLVSDAMAHYKIVVDFFDQSKDKEALLATLKRVAELDPNNVESQLKLVDLFVAEGRAEEAQESLSILTDHLSSKGLLADLVLVQERWVSLFPKDVVALEKLTKAYLRANEPKKALAKLQAAFRLDPYNTDVLELLSRTFTEMKQADKAKAVDVELVKIYRKANDEKKLKVVEDRIRGIPSSVTGGQSYLSSAKMKTEGIDPGEDLISKMDLDPEERKIISECDVYVKYGLSEKAREVLGAQLSHFPRSLALRWKMKSVLQELRLREELTHCLSEIVLLSKEQKNEAWIKLAVAELKSVDPKHPSLETGAIDIDLPPRPTEATLQESAKEAFGEELDDSDISIIVEEDLISKSQPQPDFLSKGAQDADDELLEEAERASDRRLKEQAAQMANASEEKSDVLEDYLLMEQTVSGQELIEEAPVEEVSGSETIELADMMEFATDEPESGSPSTSATKSEESDEVEFLLSDSDFSPDELKVLENQLEPQAKKDVPPTEAEVDLTFDVQDKQEEVVEDGDFQLKQVLEEIQFFKSQGLDTEAHRLFTKLEKDFPDHPAVKELKASSPDQASEQKPKEVQVEALGTKMKFTLQEDTRSDLDGDFFDLAAELADEEETKRSSVPAEVKDVFNAFKEGVSQSVGAEDFETHFDLGIAYREMGLLEDAISEFELCSKLPGKMVVSYYQLGLCEVARGDLDKARHYFDQALQSPKLDNQEKISLSYELAEVLYQLDDKTKAAELYEEVQKLDPTFRDVAERIKECTPHLKSAKK